jgi:VWFA-related protein
MTGTKEVKGVKEVKASAGTQRRAWHVGVFTSLTLFTSFLVAEQQAPTFRSRVEVVQLDVSVLDKHRQPVRGLTEKDFTILEDGKPQRIVGFSTFDMDDAPAPAMGWMRDVPPDVTTNELKESRLFIIVMDDAMIPQEPAFIRDAKKVAMSIIDKLGPDDLTAVVFTGDNRKTQDFTNDKTKLRTALDRFNPGLTSYRFGLDTNGVDTDGWFYLSAIRTLSNVADFLIAVPNRRKALFWVSPGVPLDLAGVEVRKPELGPEADRPPTPKLPNIETRDLKHRTQEIFQRAQRSNVTIYPIDPTGLGGLKQYLLLRLYGVPEPIIHHKVAAINDFIVMTAANTGGRTVMNTNDFEPGITEIFEENKSYYLIGFEPRNMKLDGTLRRIQVKVNRPDVDVRSRSSYYAPEPEKLDKRKAAVSPEAAALAKAMGGILPDAGLPMKVAVAPFAVPGQRLATVTVVLGVRQPVPEGAAKARITETTELQTSAFTPEGDPRGTQRHTARVVLRAGADGEAAYEVLGRIDLPAGRYRLRLAAHNATSARTGSVFADVIVPDYSNIPFSASPVVLSTTPGRVSAPKGLLAPLLPLVPTAERAFGTKDNVTSLLRLYQSGQKTVERAQVAIRIRDSREQLIVSETRSMAADEFRTAGQEVFANAAPTGPLTTSRILPPAQTTGQTTDRFANLSLRTADVKYRIPLATLTPGMHLLTCEATLGATTIRRDVRFEVR